MLHFNATLHSEDPCRPVELANENSGHSQHKVQAGSMVLFDPLPQMGTMLFHVRYTYTRITIFFTSTNKAVALHMYAPRGPEQCSPLPGLLWANSADADYTPHRCPSRCASDRQRGFKASGFGGVGRWRRRLPLFSTDGVGYR